MALGDAPPPALAPAVNQPLFPHSVPHFSHSCFFQRPRHAFGEGARAREAGSAAGLSSMPAKQRRGLNQASFRQKRNAACRRLTDMLRPEVGRNLTLYSPSRVHIG